MKKIQKIAFFFTIGILSVLQISQSSAEKNPPCNSGHVWSSEATIDSEGNPQAGCVPNCPQGQNWIPNASYNSQGVPFGGCASSDGW